jgi:glycosyltransferase involved in cell wall biosynthesis
MWISVVTPTFQRPREVVELLQNLCQQTLLPSEVIIVDGAPNEEFATEQAVNQVINSLPFLCKYLRSEKGTAVQRNAGINIASGNLISLLDDDVRLEPDFLEQIAKVFTYDAQEEVGGITGYRTNRHFNLSEVKRWRWYKRLNLLTDYKPGRYDFNTGYPINANLQPPFSGAREVDFLTTACAVWRRQVFDSGLRFDLFFRDYGVLEDAHFSLKASRQWKLLQCGDARCIELHSPSGRVDSKNIGYKCVVNYYYVFNDIAGPLSWHQKYRFWRFQAFEFSRVAVSAIRRRHESDWMELRGRLLGFMAVVRGADTVLRD